MNQDASSSNITSSTYVRRDIVSCTLRAQLTGCVPPNPQNRAAKKLPAPNTPRPETCTKFDVEHSGLRTSEADSTETTSGHSDRSGRNSGRKSNHLTTKSRAMASSRTPTQPDLGLIAARSRHVGTLTTTLVGHPDSSMSIARARHLREQLGRRRWKQM
jgi:hypothetical protein